MTNDRAKILAEALRDTLVSRNEEDRNLEPANVVDGLFAIARSLDRVAAAIQRLGNADAATPMGGLEALGVAVLEASDRVANALDILKP